MYAKARKYFDFLNGKKETNEQGQNLFDLELNKYYNKLNGSLKDNKSIIESKINLLNKLKFDYLEWVKLINLFSNGTKVYLIENNGFNNDLIYNFIEKEYNVNNNIITNSDPNISQHLQFDKLFLEKYMTIRIYEYIYQLTSNLNKCYYYRCEIQPYYQELNNALVKLTTRDNGQHLFYGDHISQEII